MKLINCEHPIEQIKVIWRLDKKAKIHKELGVGYSINTREDLYKVIKPTAHCTKCNSYLPDSEKQAIFAINTVMIQIARRHNAKKYIIKTVQED